MSRPYIAGRLSTYYESNRPLGGGYGMTIREDIEKLLPYTSDMRESLHRIPEIGLREYKTQAFIADQIASMGPVRWTKMADTGVWAYFKGAKGEETGDRLVAEAVPTQHTKTQGRNIRALSGIRSL